MKSKFDPSDKPTIDEAYRSEPWWYDARGFFILTFAYRSTLPAQIRFFANNISENHLEVAIGSGTLFELILKYRKWKRFPETIVTGFDYAPQMLAGAQKRFSNEKTISLIEADAAHLPFATDSFSSANIANALHCLPEPLKSLREIRRVSKPQALLAGNCLLFPSGNGLFAKISTRINDWGTRKGILLRPYEMNEVRHLLIEAGFTIEYEQVTGNCYDFVARKI